MKYILSLLLLLNSLGNAQTVSNIEFTQPLHSVEKMMHMSTDKTMDCCSENMHINCNSVVGINISIIFLQETINSMALSTPIFEASYASFVTKIPTPPPTV